MGFLATLGLIYTAFLSSLFIMASMIYYGWAGFILATLLIAAPILMVLRQQEKRSGDFDDKIFGDTQAAALDRWVRGVNKKSVEN